MITLSNRTLIRLSIALATLPTLAIVIAMVLVATGCRFDPPGENITLVDSGSGGDDDGDAAPDASTVDAAVPVVMIQNSSLEVTTGHSVFCNSGTATVRENAWYRAFRPADFGIAGTFTTTRINFPSEDSFGATVAVRIHSYTGVFDGTTLDPSKLTLINQINGFVSDSNDPAQHSAPLEAVISPDATFVVEIAATETRSPGGTPISWFHAGANTAGQTARWYFKSAACGIGVPTSQSGAQTILTVEGVF